MKSIIVLGSGNTGSSAILDYLWGRPDVRDPLSGQEFRLIQEKDGLSALHRALTVEVHPESAMYATIQFKKLADRLGADSRKIRFPPLLGYGFSRRIPAYDAAISKFVDNITASRFGVFPLQDLLQFTTLDWLRFMSGKMPRSRNIVRRKPVPVPEPVFLQCAKELIADLFCRDVPPDAILAFDQAGSFWSPVSSTEYFGEDRRIICVTRDYCDVYASQRRRRKVDGTAREFAEYQKSLNALVAEDEWRDERVLQVSFENFVLNFAEQRDRICRHVGIDPATNSSFQPKESMKSIGRSQLLLTSEERAVIGTVPPLPLYRSDKGLS